MKKMASIVVLALFAVATAACERSDATGEGAETSSESAAEDETTASAQPETVAAAEAAGEECSGGECGEGECGGEGCCGGAIAADKPSADGVPDDAVWTTLQVTGMRCGGCANKINTSLADLDGILGLEVDHEAGTVKVATAGDGAEVLAEVTPRLNDLGYTVQ